jgi:hypothetical protein
MFFARVIIGKSKTMASDANLKMPPLIENHPKSYFYDSVHG